MSAPGHTALGAWSGGRFMHFGEPLDDDRLVRLLRPDAAIHTVVTADVYGAGEADLAVGRALAGLPRESFSLVGAVGHDFYDTQRDGAKGFPRFTSPTHGPDEYAAYLREATERSLERCGVEHFDVLLLHNPDRIGYTSPASGRRWPVCARPACAMRSASRPGRPTASRSTSSAASSASAT